jgi:hypothetical protein
MSAGFDGKPTEATDRELTRLFAEDWVKAGLHIEYMVDVSHDIPYVGGVAQDGQHIYIDRRAFPALQRLGLVSGLVRHEQVEGVMMRHGYPYCDAHKLATAAENRVYRSLSMDVEWSQSQYDRFIRTDGDEDLYSVPADLDMHPYLDEPDAVTVRLVKRMRLVMVLQT